MKLFYQGQPKSLHVWTDAPSITIKYNGKNKKVSSTQNTKVVYATFGAEKDGDFIEIEESQLTACSKDGVESEVFFFL